VTKTLKTSYQKTIKALIFSALAILCLSCSKTTSNIGNGLLNGDDNIGVCYTDDIRIDCHSITIDSMATKGMPAFLLGSLVDPVMGRTDAGFFSQLHLSSTNHSFGTNPVIDSVVLQLSLDGYYGDTTTWMTAHVYELADSLSASADYYQFSSVDTKPIDLANGFQFRPHPRTYATVLNNDTVTQPVIRIPLDNSLGTMLATADTAIFGSPEAFKQFFYGLKVCCESVSQDGAISYITPTNNGVSQLQVYYRENPDANQMRYYFYITSEDIFFNQYLHDYTLGSTEFTQQVLDGDTLLGQQQLFLQSMSGVRVLLNFPEITRLTDTLEEGKHLVINEAKLIFPAYNTGDSTLLTPPTSLALLNISPNGNTALLNDYYEGTSYYGGSYNATKRQVTFRISEHLQSLLRGDASQGIYVSISGAAYNAQRWVMAGPDAPQDEKLRCEIKYTIIGE
jgi:hypothetical protein